MSDTWTNQLGPLLDELELSPDKGNQFERLTKWFLTNSPLYQGLLKKVWLWDEWPGRDHPDAGIDLVAETHQGELWAIQCKAYDPERWINKGDINSFLAESGRYPYVYRLLVATTDRIGATGWGTINDQLVPTGTLCRTQLFEAEVNWPSSLDDLRPRRLPKLRPRLNVQDAIKDVVRGFKTDDRGQLIMACGTGKTLVGLWVSERLHSQRTLVVVPSLHLMEEGMKRWSASEDRRRPKLAVCSDETVARGDQWTSHTSELGVPVTTDAEEIATFLKGSGPQVVFSTYQSSRQIAEAQKISGIEFDLVIVDEAHHTAGRCSSEFATVLDNQLVPARRRLFMTATPKTYSSRIRAEGGELDIEFATMDDPVKYGPVFHTLTFGDAIDKGLLTDYRVVIVGVTDETLTEDINQALIIDTDAEEGPEDLRLAATQVAFIKAMEKYGIHRIITYHNTVDKARLFSSTLPPTFSWLSKRTRPQWTIKSSYVSGSIPVSDRKRRIHQTLAELQDDERGVVCNARCLGEGVDIPAVDGVAFVDPRRSKIDIAQAVGRALRSSPGKEISTILLPVFIDTSMDPEEALNDDKVWKPVWDVLLALRSIDEVLGQEMDESRRALGKRTGGKARAPAKLITDLATSIDASFAEKLELKIVEHATSLWEYGFGKAEAYADREGHANVPHSYTDPEDGYQLGWWVATQRRAKNGISTSILTPDRITRLQSLPGWTWNGREEHWDVGFDHLKKFEQSHGHVKVLQDYIDPEDGYKTGRWVANQRTGKRGTGTSVLTPDRIARLDTLKGWAWEGDEIRRDAKWEVGFDHLKKFEQSHGHVKVPLDYIDSEDGYKTGAWVATQRRAKKGTSTSTLTPDRIARLETLKGWVWKADMWATRRGT